MLNKPIITAQLNFLQPRLKEQLSNKHPLYILAERINWSLFEESFGKHYKEDFGRPAKAFRLMVALLMLKHIRNLSDEKRSRAVGKIPKYDAICVFGSFLESPWYRSRNNKYRSSAVELILCSTLFSSSICFCSIITRKLWSIVWYFTYNFSRSPCLICNITVDSIASIYNLLGCSA